MKLWVDDIRNAPGDDWVVARTITDAIRTIAKFDLDEISLDHDISHQVGMGALSRPYPCPECFCAVAYFLSAKKFLIPTKITIHTANPVGGEEMMKIFLDSGILAELRPMGMINRLEMEA